MFEITDKAIDVDTLRHDLADPAAGGMVIFEGVVRDHNEGRAVSALEYEIFVSMAEKEAARIMAEAQDQFDVIHLRGAHRFGLMGIGEMAVWVGASARHREAAFKACRYLIDEIKYRLPVWKKEHYVEGSSEWVDCEGCAHHHQPEFTEQEYYSRQTRMSDFGESGQASLGSARVLVVGAGGLGCPALSTLTGAGVGQITVCDGDILAVSNLHRQTLYGHQEVGQFKAQLATQKLHELNPLITINAVSENFSPVNAAALLAGHDVVLDCTDNFSTKFLLHDACYLARKVLVQASIYQYEGQIQVFDFRDDSTAGCMRCTWPKIPAADCVGSCAEVGVLGAVATVLGGMQAMETIKYLAGRLSPATSATVLVDLQSLQTTAVKRPRDPSCPLCGDRPGIVGIIDQEYEPRQFWEIGMSEFSRNHPQGHIVDIRSQEERGTPVGAMASWENLPNPDHRELLDLAGQNEVLLVCHVGVRTRRLVDELRAAGHQRFWSLWGGTAGL